jgi:hypothetical protein
MSMTQFFYLPMQRLLHQCFHLISTPKNTLTLCRPGLPHRLLPCQRTLLSCTVSTATRRCQHRHQTRSDPPGRRRRILQHLAAALLVTPHLSPDRAKASNLGPGVDQAWEAMGGGPPDLFFPDEFLGTWQVILWMK